MHGRLTALGGLAIAFGSVWVGHNGERRLYRIALPVTSGAAVRGSGG